MKPTTRNGLIALVVVLLVINVGVVIKRIGRDEPRTQVSSAPTTAPLTTTTATTSPPTTGPPAAGAPTAQSPATGFPAQTTTTAAPAAGAPSATATTSPPATTNTTNTTTVRAPADADHPKTGGLSMFLPALFLIGLGLTGLRLSARSGRSITARTDMGPETDTGPRAD